MLKLVARTGLLMSILSAAYDVFVCWRVTSNGMMRPLNCTESWGCIKIWKLELTVKGSTMTIAGTTLSYTEPSCWMLLTLAFLRSAAELFRINTGKTLIKNRGEKGRKYRVASTANLVQAAAVKLTDIHNSKQSSGQSSGDPSVSSAHCFGGQETNRAIPHTVIQKDFIYKGQHYPFTSQHFETGTQQWRLILLFHNFLDVEVYSFL